MTDTRTIMEMTKGSEEDKLFEGAFNSILHMDKKDYPSYVGGLKVASGHEFTVTSPIDDTICFGRFQEPEEDLPDQAVTAAMKAFKTWSKTGMEERIGIFDIVLKSVVRQRYRLAAAITLSTGMIRSRSIEEVDMLSGILEREIERARSDPKGRPMGVWAVVSEHNSPLAAPIGYAAAMMLAGNTVIMMPSAHSPIPIYLLYDIFTAAKLPDGVLNLITDRRGKATDNLVESEFISGITAIGSGERMEEMMFLQLDDSARFINEVKGMNPVLVRRPHNMVQAARSILNNAFSFSGQDITSPSKVVILAEEQKQFVEAVLKAASDIVVGDPAEPVTTIGPVISKDNSMLFSDIVGSVKEYVIFGGKTLNTEPFDSGNYVVPAIISGLSADNELNNIDHGVPILSIQIAGDIEEALEMVNGCDIGRSSGIYTKDAELAEYFKNRSSAENVYVNDPGSIPKCGFRANMEEFVK